MKNQIASLHQRQTILKILIFTLVTSVIWVGLALFRTQRQTAIDPELIKISESLNPNINTEVLGRIEAKKAYSDQELSDFPVYSIVNDKGNGEKTVVFNASDKAKKPEAPAPVEKASPAPVLQAPVTPVATDSAQSPETQAPL